MSKRKQKHEKSIVKYCIFTHTVLPTILRYLYFSLIFTFSGILFENYYCRFRIFSAKVHDVLWAGHGVRPQSGGLQRESERDGCIKAKIADFFLKK